MSIENIVPSILPQLFAKPVAASPSLPREEHDARAIELARRLIALDQDGAADLIQQRLAREKSPPALFTGLFEPSRPGAWRSVER
ncbi:MAG: hypothetical protein MZV49_15170 [Rhodopseudomonas palustris]|nr:hypothetical protein [Rhodopseudomonas palustris]